MPRLYLTWTLYSHTEYQAHVPFRHVVYQEKKNHIILRQVVNNMLRGDSQKTPTGFDKSDKPGQTPWVMRQ